MKDNRQHELRRFFAIFAGDNQQAMISGHGDDAFRFARAIVANFSSNVYAHVDLEPLKAHLRQRIDVIGHYPEPEPSALERALAERHGIDPAAVCVTNGATEAIYLTAHAFADRLSTILGPTFSEYFDACRLYTPSDAHSTAPDSGEQGIPSGANGTLRVCEHSTRKSHVCSTRPTLASLPEIPPLLHSLGISEHNSGWFSGWTAFFLPARTKTRAAKRAERCPVKPGMTDGGKPGGMVWICNPNNPTGDVVPKERLEKAIEDNPGTVFVIDQSYGFFTREPLLSAAEAVRYPNVIQLHSMTKRYAIPGIRLGYFTANPGLTERIRAVRMPWSVNALAIEAGLYLCRHPDTAPIDLDALLAETRRLHDALNALPGLTALPTQTHFFLCHLEEGRAADLKQWLAENHGILIRDAANFEGLDEGHFRIATQTAEENDLLVDAIRNYLEDRR